MRTWALELECAEMDKQRKKKAWVKKVDPYPLIWEDGIARPHPPGKLAYLPSTVINGTVGLPMAILMRIPE